MVNISTVVRRLVNQKVNQTTLSSSITSPQGGDYSEDGRHAIPSENNHEKLYNPLYTYQMRMH
jgi:hypothetical protein